MQKPPELDRSRGPAVREMPTHPEGVLADRIELAHMSTESALMGEGMGNILQAEVPRLERSVQRKVFPRHGLDVVPGGIQRHRFSSLGTHSLYSQSPRSLAPRGCFNTQYAPNRSLRK